MAYDYDNNDGEDVYSKPVKAGRRTYFFDVKATKGDDYFITITESRRKQNNDGSVFYNKHKIYLYKEDFLKFSGGLKEVIDYVRTHQPGFSEQGAEWSDTADSEFDNL